MKSSLPLSVVIPVYNNEKTLEKELKKVKETLKQTSLTFEIILAEDKSTDNSQRILKKFEKQKNIKVIYNKTNLGIAKNIFQLYKSARNKYIVLFSLDGDWNSNDIKKLITAIENNNSDFVIGKRTKKNYSPFRSTISFLYNFLPIILFGVETKDAGSIKIFKKTIFNSLSLQPTSVFFEAEMIIKATKSGYKVISIPITSSKKNKIETKKQKLKLAIEAFRDIVRLKFNEV